MELPKRLPTLEEFNNANEAAFQAMRHALGRLGESIAQKFFGGDLTSHTAPFDLIDWDRKIGYEIKTVRAETMESTIRIKPPSMARKMEFAAEHKLKIVLIAVVIYDEEEEICEIYASPIRPSAKPRWMNLIKKRNQELVQRERIPMKRMMAQAA